MWIFQKKKIVYGLKTKKNYKKMCCENTFIAWKESYSA